MLFHLSQTIQLDLQTIAGSFFYGLILDISFAAYLSVLPFLFYIVSFYIFKTWINKGIKIYTTFFVIILSALMIVDMGLYEAWGIRLDSTPINYLNTPKEMLASINYTQLVWAILFYLAVVWIILKLFNRLGYQMMKPVLKPQLGELSLYLFLWVALILPIRGGFQTIPVNQSNVYFSNHMYANHAAINFAWNFTHSFIDRTYDTSNPFNDMEMQLANEKWQSYIADLRAPLSNEEKGEWLNLTKPNVLLIIWEGLTAKAVRPLGGLATVTENLNRYAAEGLLFTNFYANGDRTDKGLISLLSGYYPQTQKSIIKVPNKSKSLPMLPLEMNALGYDTKFYYGGNTNFGNMNTYLKSAGISEVIGGNQFQRKNWNSKWGAHDHILFNRVLKDMGEYRFSKPFFNIVLTLTSHEPYEFPGPQKFGMDTKENKYLSSLAYTDQALADFLDEARKQPWWENTLVIITADHGNPLPKHPDPYNSPAKYHIPMIWTGGAVKNPGRIVENIGSQIDLSYSLLDLLGGQTSEFVWSQNILHEADRHYAQYIYNNGFGILDKKNAVLFDYNINSSISKQGRRADELEELGKAITQTAYQDYLDRGKITME
ncbi:alkaline phosphatase family protein [Membranihabitans marinus]